MPQKDFILREIEKIGVLLQYLIGKFVPSKSLKEQQQTEELFSKELKEHYGKDLNYILNINQEDFDFEFTQNKGFNYENIELLADLLFTLGNNNDFKNLKYLKKALELYSYIDIKSKTYSFDRIDKINTLKEILNIDINN